MERMVKCSTTMLCLTLLHIVSVNLQPLEFTSKASAKVNNEKKETLNNSSTQTGASTHPYLFDNIETTKVEASTHSVEVSTFPPLIREPLPPSIKNPQLIIHFPNEIDTSASRPVNDTELQISIEDRVNLPETTSYLPPTKNPNLQVLPLSAPINVTSSEPTENTNLRVSTTSVHKNRISGEETMKATQNPNFTISTHPPLLSEMESTRRTEAITITSPPTISTNTLETSTYPPPSRNPNLGISIHRPEKINATTPSTPFLDVNGTLTSDSDIPSKNTTIEDKLDNEKCAFAIVGCCPRVVASNDSCFRLLGCPGPFWGKKPCDKDIIDKAIKIVNAYYSRKE